MDRVETLIEALKKHPFSLARRTAVIELSKIKDRRVVPALIEALEDESCEVRDYAVEKLVKIGDPSAVPALTKTLIRYPSTIFMLVAASRNVTYQREAGLTLSDFKDASSIFAFVKALEEKDSNVVDFLVRGKAVEALAEIGDASAVPALIEIVKDKDGIKGVRKDAHSALIEIGAPAVPALIEAIEDENKHMREWSPDALRRIIDRCKTMEDIEKIEKELDKGSAALRKKHVDKKEPIDAQMQVAKLLRRIAKRKDELAPKRDLLLDDKPKPPKKGGGVYQEFRKDPPRRLMRT